MNAAADFLVGSDDGREELLAAASAVANTAQVLSSLFWKQMEQLFHFISEIDTTFLRQQLGDLKFGSWIESFIHETRIQLDGFLTTSLIDLYAKCGSIDKAYKLFHGLKKKDFAGYTAMILGCEINGRANDAIVLFDEMMNAETPFASIENDLMKMALNWSATTFWHQLAECRGSYFHIWDITLGKWSEILLCCLVFVDAGASFVVHCYHFLASIGSVSWQLLSYLVYYTWKVVGNTPLLPVSGPHLLELHTVMLQFYH